MISINHFGINGIFYGANGMTKLPQKPFTPDLIPFVPILLKTLKKIYIMTLTIKKRKEKCDES